MYSQYVLFFSYYSQWEGGWRCVETLVIGVFMTRDDSSYCSWRNVRYLWCIETLVSSYVTSPIGGGGEISLMYSPARGRRVVGVCSVFCIISDIPILGFQTFISTFGTTSNWNRKMFSTSIYRHIVMWGNHLPPQQVESQDVPLQPQLWWRPPCPACQALEQ